MKSRNFTTLSAEKSSFPEAPQNYYNGEKYFGLEDYKDKNEHPFFVSFHQIYLNGLQLKKSAVPSRAFFKKSVAYLNDERIETDSFAGLGKKLRSEVKFWEFLKFETVYNVKDVEGISKLEFQSN